jgi:hypothetical protein
VHGHLFRQTLPPAFPIPLPAIYSIASLFNSSRPVIHEGGTPVRYGSRGMGVKLHTIRMVSSGRFLMRNSETNGSPRCHCNRPTQTRGVMVSNS